jgi:hypothetical protein
LIPANSNKNQLENTLQLESGKPIRDLLSPYLNQIDDGGYEFDFNKIIPIPEDLNIESRQGKIDDDLQDIYETNMFKHGFRTWYEFCVVNWGTKWKATGDFNYDDTAFTFETAWSPSLPITEELAKKLEGDETLIHNYIETGMGFCGKFVAGNLGGIDEFYDDIKNAPQSLKDELGWEPWEEENDLLIETEKTN